MRTQGRGKKAAKLVSNESQTVFGIAVTTLGLSLARIALSGTDVGHLPVFVQHAYADLL